MCHSQGGCDLEMKMAYQVGRFRFFTELSVGFGVIFCKQKKTKTKNRTLLVRFLRETS